MTSKQVACLVDQAIELDSQIDLLTEQRNAIKLRLLNLAGQYLREESGIKDLVGSSYTIRGHKRGSCVCCWPKPKLISGFFFIPDNSGHDIAWRTKDDKATQVGDVKALAGLAFDRLFAKSWKPAKGFRELVPSHLEKAAASKLVALLEEPSAPRVGFETK